MFSFSSFWEFDALLFIVRELMSMNSLSVKQSTEF